MKFEHNETSWVIKRLQYVNWKWTYQNTWNTYSGHMKPISIDDKTFSITLEAWYKWTIKRSIEEWIADIKESDKVDVNWEIFIVKAVKFFPWINFATTKVLLSK